jgi:hypothetical protein
LRAVDLCPDYPGNRLDLAESYLKWNEWPAMRMELARLQELWPQARKSFAGDAWVSNWVEWNKRLEDLQNKLKNKVQSPHSQP